MLSLSVVTENKIHIKSSDEDLEHRADTELEGVELWDKNSKLS